MWIGPLALAVGALWLAGPAYAFSPLAGGSLLVIAGIATVWSLVLGVGPKLRGRGVYDLQELRRVHEEESLRALEPEEALGRGETVICSRCMFEFPSRIRACPRCGTSG